MDKYEYLRPGCQTDPQHELLDILKTVDTLKEACNLIGCNERNVRAKLQRIKRNANREGVSLSDTSTMYDADGNVKIQWVKTKKNREELKDLAEDIRDALTESLPRAKPVEKKSKPSNSDLLNLYTVTDYHIGMRSWPEETGADFDLKIAEELLIAWFKEAINRAPSAGTAILGQLGDFLHWDGIDAVTPTSGHILDADSRFQKLPRTAIRVVRAIVKMLLKKHDKVHIIMAEGNHDLASSAWLREIFAAFYEDDPRITVDTSPDIYYCYEFGQTSLFWHHGHKKRPHNIDDVFVAKFREVFGRTKHSYAHMGHLHHDKTLETNLMHVYQHRTLASPDSHSSRGGWLSSRGAPVDTYHKEYGLVGRLEITPEMV